MNDRKNFIPEQPSSLGVTERSGQVIQRDIGLYYENKMYVLSVGTKDYLDIIKKYNEAFGSEEQIDENVLVLETVDKIEDVVESLAKLELDQVLPYLVEQKEQE